MRLLMYNSWNGLNTGEVVRYLRYQPGRYLVHAPYHYQTPFRTWNSKVPKTLGLGMSYNSCRFKRHWKTHLNVWQAIGKWSFVTAPRQLWGFTDHTQRPPVINKDVWRKDRSVLRVSMRWMPAKQLQSSEAYCTKASLKVQNFDDKDTTCAFSFARSQSWQSSIQHFAQISYRNSHFAK